MRNKIPGCLFLFHELSWNWCSQCYVHYCQHTTQHGIWRNSWKERPKVQNDFFFRDRDESVKTNTKMSTHMLKVLFTDSCVDRVSLKWRSSKVLKDFSRICLFSLGNFARKSGKRKQNRINKKKGELLIDIGKIDKPESGRKLLLV